MRIDENGRRLSIKESLLIDLQYEIDNVNFSDNIESPTIEDYYEYDENDGCHLAAILRMVILETEGVEFTACNNFSDQDFLIYEPIYPWGLTEIDKTMTKEKLESILCKYLSMITEIVPEFGYQEAENGG